MYALSHRFTFACLACSVQTKYGSRDHPKAKDAVTKYDALLLKAAQALPACIERAAVAAAAREIEAESQSFYYLGIHLRPPQFVLCFITHMLCWLLCVNRACRAARRLCGRSAQIHRSH